MSSAKEEEEVERIYTIPISRAWISPRQRRSVRAINIIKEFAAKHMKSSEVKIAPEVSELIWKRGIRNPPRRLSVKMAKDKEGVVTVSLPTGE